MRVLIWFAAVCSVLASSVFGETLRIEKGEIEGARYAWAQPPRWNRCILLLAHGFRPEAAPLVADLLRERAAYKALLDEGWIVAKTSYRRNGIIIQDAMNDLDNLRAEIVRRVGKPTRVIVEGESMGGLIAVLIAERAPEEVPLYHGAVAIGPALEMREPTGDAAGLTMTTQLPVVFLCNRSEIESARLYTQFKAPGHLRPSAPVLLRANRDGHVNVNQAERLTALRALNQWLDTGVETLPKPAPGAISIDITAVPEPLPSRVLTDPDMLGFTAHVVEVSRVFGNILLDAQPADFSNIGLGVNARFRLTLREQSFSVLIGKEFSSVKHGQWVTFLNADGFYWLARNGLNAAEQTQAEVGDLVHVRRFEPPSDPARGTDNPFTR